MIRRPRAHMLAIALLCVSCAAGSPQEEAPVPRSDLRRLLNVADTLMAHIARGDEYPDGLLTQDFTYGLWPLDDHQERAAQARSWLQHRELLGSNYDESGRVDVRLQVRIRGRFQSRVCYSDDTTGDLFTVRFRRAASGWQVREVSIPIC